MLTKKLRSHYKRLLYKGRGPIARGLDFIAFRIILFFVAWIPFATILKSSWQGAVMATILVALISVILEWGKEQRLAKFVMEKRKDLCKEYQMDRLVVMDPNQFLTMVSQLVISLGYQVMGILEGAILVQYGEERSMVFPIQSHRSYQITPQDLLDMSRILRANGLHDMLLVTTCSLSEEARSFQRKIPALTLSILKQDSLLNQAIKMGHMPGIKEMEESLLVDTTEQEMSLSKFRLSALYSGKTRAYILCGLIVIAATYFTGFNLYYPMVAAFCFLMAYLCHRNERVGREKGPTG